MLDLDDFKRVNDIYGHAVGDQVLAELAAQLRAVVRESDDVCRTGGEEFAIIVRSGDLEVAQALAERVAERIAIDRVPTCRPHDALDRDRARARARREPPRARRLRRARDDDGQGARQEPDRRLPRETRASDPVSRHTRGDDLRSIAHLKMLHGVSSKLSRLLEIEEIGATIADELRQLIDYHNCRVFLRDGDDLWPVAFRGDLRDAPGRRSRCSRPRSASGSRATSRRPARRS